MSLMFSRVARNFVKKGFFPTDEETVARILALLSLETPDNKSNNGRIFRLLDPCAGEGRALHVIGKSFQETDNETPVTTLGVELDLPRARVAETLLEKVACSDVQDMTMSPRSMSLIWCNPPYGNTIPDKTGSSGSIGAMSRIEEIFVRCSLKVLATRGLLVLLIPHSQMTVDMARLLISELKNIRCYRAVDRTYNQLVVLGTRRSTISFASNEQIEALAKFADADKTPDFPTDVEIAANVKALNEAKLTPPQKEAKVLNEAKLTPPDKEAKAGATALLPLVHVIPAVPSALHKCFQFTTRNISAELLAYELSKVAISKTLWGNFGSFFRHQMRTMLPPLMKMKDWHKAIALVSGHVNGISSNSKGIFLIKGQTLKRKTEVIEQKEEEKEIAHLRILTDTFVPELYAVNITRYDDSYGEIICVRK